MGGRPQRLCDNSRTRLSGQVRLSETLLNPTTLRIDMMAVSAKNIGQV